MSNTSTPRRLGRTGLGLLAATSLLAAGLAAGSAPTASASPSSAARVAAGSGTITYVLGGNVFVAGQDGTSPRQVTTDGSAANPWYSPTQSDDGHIVAGHGNLIHRMDQWGHVLNTIDPPDLRSGGSETLGGAPAQLAVSPDGATVAYTYVKNYCSFPNNVCRDWPVTGFTSSTGLTPPETYGTTYGDTPSWVTNSRVVVDNRGPFDNIYLYELSRGTVGYYWFDDDNVNGPGYTSVTDVEISRGAPYAVLVRGTYDQTRVALLDVSNLGDYRGGIPTPPSPTNRLCQTTAVPGMTSPTWSADGATAAWREPDGVWMMAMGAAPCQTQPALVIPGATSPSFSPAALQTVPPKYIQTFEVKKKATVAGKAKVGKKLKAKAARLAPAATKVRFQWLRGKKPIKHATKATYKVSRKDRKHQLRVRTTSIRKGYKTVVSVSKPVRVKR
jgi:hypothetical protein